MKPSAVNALCRYNIQINKRPMDHIARLRNQFKSINTFGQYYDYIITLIRRRKNSLFFCLKTQWSFFVKPLSLKDALWQVAWNWPSGSGEENFIYMYFAIRNYLPFKKGVALNLNKFGSTLPKDALFQVWLKLVLWFLRRRFLDLVNVYIWILVIISPWKTECSFIWTNLNPLHPRMLCAN